MEQPAHTDGVFLMSHGRLTKRYGLLVSAPTGHRSIVLPVKRPSYGSPLKVAISVWSPRSWKVSWPSSATSWLNRTQRKHAMQRSRSSATSGERSSGLGKCSFGSSERVRPGPKRKVRSCSGHSPPLSHTGQSSGWLASSSSSTPSWASFATSLSVFTTMSGATGVEQAVCSPRMPSTSTRHMRHAPMGAPRRGS